MCRLLGDNENYVQHLFPSTDATLFLSLMFQFSTSHSVSSAYVHFNEGFNWLVFFFLRLSSRKNELAKSNIDCTCDRAINLPGDWFRVCWSQEHATSNARMWRKVCYWTNAEAKNMLQAMHGCGAKNQCHVFKRSSGFIQTLRCRRHNLIQCTILSSWHASSLIWTSYCIRKFSEKSAKMTLKIWNSFHCRSSIIPQFLLFLYQGQCDMLVSDFYLLLITLVSVVCFM